MSSCGGFRDPAPGALRGRTRRRLGGGEVPLGRRLVPAVADRLLRRAAVAGGGGGARPAGRHRRVRRPRRRGRAAARPPADDGHRHPGPRRGAARRVAGGRAGRRHAVRGGRLRHARRPLPQAQPGPRRAGAGQGPERAARGGGDGHRRRRGRGLRRRRPARSCAPRPARTARRSRRVRPSEGGSDAVELRPADPALPVAGGGGCDAVGGDRRRRRGGRLRRSLGDGPLPPDPAGRARVGGHARELHDARLPRGGHPLAASRRARVGDHLPQRRPPGEDRRHARRAVRRPRHVRAGRRLVRARAPRVRVGLPGAARPLRAARGRAGSCCR